VDTFPFSFNPCSVHASCRHICSAGIRGVARNSFLEGIKVFGEISNCNTHVQLPFWRHFSSRNKVAWTDFGRVHIPPLATPLAVINASWGDLNVLLAINLRRVPYTGAKTSGAETPVPRCPSAEKSQRRNGERRDGDAETAAPKRRRRNVTYRVMTNHVISCCVK